MVVKSEYPGTFQRSSYAFTPTSRSYQLLIGDAKFLVAARKIIDKPVVSKVLTLGK